MSNLFAIPFKKTYQIDIKAATANFITNYAGAHPEEFKDDIREWQHLRDEGTGGMVHENKVQSALLYHAQLVSILAKLPNDIQLSIPYAPAFNPETIPVSLNSLIFERACVLFNLAALYSQLATREDRSSAEGIKRATTNYQLAAGTLSYLKTTVLPKLVVPHDEDYPVDLSEGFISGMELLMLSQAQECSWQLARLNQYKNSLIAKIAARVAELYESAYEAFTHASPSVKGHLPSDWLPHIQVKSLHFTAVAQFRKSKDEIESGSNYGAELARLYIAQENVKKAYDIARRGKVSAHVLQDTQSLMEGVEKDVVRAQRDNDLIYHKDVPAASSLPEIQGTNIAKATVPQGWPIRMRRSDIYNHRKEDLIRTKIVDASRELQDSADEQLRKLNLPASLEALERPIGLPPSLLKKAEEVRLENGPDKIEASLDDVEMLAKRDASILEEALDVLDTEASEDEASRKEFPISRPPSHEANVELTEKAQRYRQILTQARESDEVVRQKWYEWEDHIRQLTEDEATLEQLIPSTTQSRNTRSTPESRATAKLAQSLRNRLEDLDVLHRDRAHLVRRAKALAEKDDIQERVTKAAAGFEKLAELDAAMFEDILDQELAKYDRYLVDMEEQSKRVEEALEKIKSDNEAFVKSRKDDPRVKEREQALQQLDAAYFKYREIERNLDEGNKFYNDLADILIQFKEVCKAWSYQRNQELHALTKKMQTLSINVEDEPAPEPEPGTGPTEPTATHSAVPTANIANLPPQPPSPRFPTNKPSRKPLPGRSALGKLPALTSADWEWEEMRYLLAPIDKKKK
ncbi:hypothetical protein NMY22_g12771 [Coprinellus aureogranulatus]|nr:hypothetical protein NMY22_g12771 [Coprinellus aureogranulatus]